MAAALDVHIAVVRARWLRSFRVGNSGICARRIVVIRGTPWSQDFMS